MQHVAPAPAQDHLLFLPEELGCGRIVFQNGNVVVDDKDRHGHGIKENTMKTLIKELDSDLGHNEEALAELIQDDKQHSQ
jgi:hypothetical protein